MKHQSTSENIAMYFVFAMVAFMIGGFVWFAVTTEEESGICEASGGVYVDRKCFDPSAEIDLTQ